MAQPIKYNPGSLVSGCCIKKGNYNIGIIPSHPYGPTSSTGFWAGYPPGTTIPTGGFISYQNKASQGPSIYSIANVNEIVEYGKNLNIGVQNTPEDVLYACANLDTIALVNIDYPALPQINNNRLTLDAGYTASNPWTNTSWFDITGNGNTGILNGSAEFSSGTSVVNYSDSRVSQQASLEDAMVLVPVFGGTLSNFTVNVWINSGGNGFGDRINVVGQQYLVGATPQNDCNFLIRGNGTNGYEGLIRAGGTNYTVNFGVAGGGWINLTLTFDGNEINAYSDGFQTGSNITGPIVGLTSNGLQTIIGGTTNGASGQGASNYFDGGINVVNIYDIALNPSEVTDLYNSYQGRF